MLSATSGTRLHVKWVWENKVYARDSDKYAYEMPTYIQGHQLRNQKKEFGEPRFGGLEPAKWL